MKITKGYKIFLFILSIVAIFAFCIILFWIKGLPYLFSNEKVLSFISNSVYKATGANLTIEKSYLKTDFSPNIDIKIGKIELQKEKQKLLNITNLDFDFSLSKILKKDIIIQKLTLDELFVDIDKLSELTPKKTNKKDA